jgi:hypothetical protein
MRSKRTSRRGTQGATSGYEAHRSYRRCPRAPDRPRHFPRTGTDRLGLEHRSCQHVDASRGDAILFRSAEGKAALIDAGPRKEIVPQLRRLYEADQYVVMPSISAGDRCLSMREYGCWMDGSPASMSTWSDFSPGQIRPRRKERRSGHAASP